MVFLLVIVIIPAIGYMVLQNRSLQNALAKKITSSLSSKFHTKVTISSVGFTLFDNLIIKNLYIEDQKKDTLLYTPELIIQIKDLLIAGKKITISKATLEQPVIHFTNDSTGAINFQFIIEGLKPKDTLSIAKPWDFKCLQLELVHGRFSFKNYIKKKVAQGLNYTDISLHDLNLGFENVQKGKQGVHFEIKMMNFAEMSGFKLGNLSADAEIGKHNINLKHLSILTQNSDIHASTLAFEFDSLRQFRSGVFGNKVKLDLNMEKSIISSYDLSYFAPQLNGLDMTVKLSGLFTGKIADLKGNKVICEFGQFTKFKGNFSLNGLPKLSETFIYLNVNELITSQKDIQEINIPNSNHKHIYLPPEFEKLGLIHYKGKFTGFYNDFVTYGIFNTDLGEIQSDLSLKPDTSKFIRIDGRLQTNNFSVGKLIGQEDVFGNISLNVNINGYASSRKNLKLLMNGGISKFVVNHYSYQNIILNGTLTDKTYNGSMSIEDPNVKLNLLGRFDLSDSIPEFNFTINVDKANLFKLNFDPHDSTSSIAFNLIANFTGKNLDKLNGNIKIDSAIINKRGHLAKIKNVSLIAKNTGKINWLTLKSDFVDAEMNGKYQFNTLAKSFNSILYKYLPSLKEKEKAETKVDSTNNFSFQVHIKKAKQIFQLYLPGLYLSENSEFAGYFNSRKKSFSALGTFSEVDFGDNIWHNLTVNASTNDTLISLITSSKDLVFNKKLTLGNFVFSSMIHNNLINMNLRCYNADSVRNVANFSASAFFSRPIARKNPLIKVLILPSSFLLGDSVWYVNQCLVNIDSSSVKINNLKIFNSDQSIHLYGTISKSVNDTLSVILDNLDMLNTGLFFNGKGIRAEGNAFGRVKINSVLLNPSFRADLEIDTLLLNGEKFGRSIISAAWDNDKNVVHISEYSNEGETKTLSFDGDYFPLDKKVDFNISLYKTRLNILRPYLEKIMSNLNGSATGDVRMTGSIKHPVFNGNLKLQKVSLLVNYLQTRYNFTNDVEIKNNKFVFNNVNIFDSYGDVAIANGTIEEVNFSDFVFDIGIKAHKFLCLNTTQKDNPLYYGKTFATGVINITGNLKNISMNIFAKTEPNTQFYIPLTTRTDISENKFVNFINNKPEKKIEKKKENDYQVDLSGFSMRLDLEATPDATVQVIFDSKIGDIIRGKGSGNLQLDINTRGTFIIKGEYSIDEGDYLFTLQNVINKKFVIDKGGTITWSGSPYDAVVDIKAIYKLKTSLYNLLGDENYRNAIPVECQITMTDKLMSPTVKYDIELPNADAETNTMFKAAVNTDEENSKQFLSLMVLNSFIADSKSTTTGPNLGTTTGMVTAGELLSSQLGNWLSQINSNFNIGVNLRPADINTTEQIGMMISTQINDRVVINGNVDYGGQNKLMQTTNTNDLAGNFDVEYKLGKKGKVRLKAFNRANDRFINEISPYTQGVSIFYREEFSSFGDLFRKFSSKYPVKPDTSKIDTTKQKP